MPDLIQSFEYAGRECSSVIFDYDSTIAQVPVDWAKARVDCHRYLENLFPGLDLPKGLRVDEMEARALAYAPSNSEQVFEFRHRLESDLDGSHEEVEGTIALIRLLVSGGRHHLFIVSNNLHRTVEHGLKKLGLADAFEMILGIDDVGVPKPDTKAFDLLAQSSGVTVEGSVFIGDSDETDGIFCSRLGIRYLNINRLDRPSE